uniref:Uncharacterized protein n=1 Tax=Sphaerodactylus townsendi TaxID=933632 RepID=A0ACB8FZU9_9SAUR
MAGRGGSPLEAALGRLGGALGCSRCHNLLKKPVNLGNCEHVFCLSCVVDCVGTACPVCHIPSRVQDVKVNRQLDNIARLYRRLQRLQGGDHSGKINSGLLIKTSGMWVVMVVFIKKRKTLTSFTPPCLPDDRQILPFPSSSKSQTQLKQVPPIPAALNSYCGKSRTFYSLAASASMT